MKPLLLAFNLLCGADAATTHRIVTTGGIEVLLPTQNPYAIDAVIAAEAVMGTRGIQRIHASGHPKAAIVVGVAMVAFRGYVVAHNLRQMSSR